MFIVDDLLFWLPANSFVSILKKIREMVNDELNEDQRKKLMAIDGEFESGYLSDEQYFDKGLKIINEKNDE